MKKQNVAALLQGNSYPGRGILLGKSGDGRFAVAVYFIMGRSENSRNRIFAEQGAGIRTEAFDSAKLSDPSLIIYSPVRVLENTTIVTNGDQTDTIYATLRQGGSFADALHTRTFEPDAPNYTPRVSGLMCCENGALSYQLSILKSANGNPEGVLRFFYNYDAPLNGEGHLIHTYLGDGIPIPSFEGEPVLVGVENDIDTYTKTIWESLNTENKVSLFVRYLRLSDGQTETRIVNKNK